MRYEKQGFLYIMANWTGSTLYTGVTNDLKRRVFEHRSREKPGFTRDYATTKLVYYEQCEDIFQAIWREKQVKAGSRNKKIDLVNRLNPEWRDLYFDV